MKKPAKPVPGEEPKRFRKYTLARYLGISRPTLDTYLNRTDPPPPLTNSAGEWNGEEVAAYIASIKADAGVTKNLGFYKTEKIRLECERIAFDLAKQRREFITRAEITASITPLIAELDQAMEQQFVQILPSRYRAHTPIECAEMNQKAKDQITARFRSGVKELTAA